MYSSLKLPELFRRVFSVVQWQGDRSVGTIFTVTLNPGPLQSYKEKLVTLDQQRRIKELDMIEGGVRDRDFTFYRLRSQFVKNGPKSTLFMINIRYELNVGAPTASENMKLANIRAVSIVGDLVSNYLKNQTKGA